jgi:hypothetical protein
VNKNNCIKGGLEVKISPHPPYIACCVGAKLEVGSAISFNGKQASLSFFIITTVMLESLVASWYATIVLAEHTSFSLQFSK